MFWQFGDIGSRFMLELALALSSFNPYEPASNLNLRPASKLRKPLLYPH